MKKNDVILEEKQNELYAKISNILNKDREESDNENVTLFDVKSSIISEFGPYNKVLVDNGIKDIRKINRSSVYERYLKTKNSLPRLTRIIYSTTKNNNKYAKLFFGNGYVSMLIGFKDGLMNIISTSFTKNASENFLNSNYDLLYSRLSTLESFNNEYPNEEVEFDSETKYHKYKNENEQFISDGFMGCYVDFNHPESMHSFFDNLDDYEVSLTHSNKYGVLMDYIVLYDDEILSKVKVNIDDLNPLVRKIYDNYLMKKENNNAMSLKLSK